jgi:uncharacterized membrane protein YvbJ
MDERKRYCENCGAEIIADSKHCSRCGIDLTTHSQHGDIIQWDQSNRAYVMTHGVSGIDWKHNKHPLRENVYDVYMKYWAGVSFKTEP